MYEIKYCEVLLPGLFTFCISSKITQSKVSRHDALFNKYLIFTIFLVLNSIKKRITTVVPIFQSRYYAKHYPATFTVSIAERVIYFIRSTNRSKHKFIKNKRMEKQKKPYGKIIYLLSLFLLLYFNNSFSSILASQNSD